MPIFGDVISHLWTSAPFSPAQPNCPCYIRRLLTTNRDESDDKNDPDLAPSCVSADTLDEANIHFLHGRLRVHVIAAQDLPDTDTAFFNIDRGDKTDPYVTGDLGTARLFKTKYIKNELNPTWNEVRSKSRP